jgi:hypothetical protein
MTDVIEPVVVKGKLFPTRIIKNRDKNECISKFMHPSHFSTYIFWGVTMNLSSLRSVEISLFFHNLIL